MRTGTNLVGRRTNGQTNTSTYVVPRFNLSTASFCTIGSEYVVMRDILVVAVLYVCTGTLGFVIGFLLMELFTHTCSLL